MRHDYIVVYQSIEDGWIMATVPELPGAVTQGATLEEARANIQDAVELLLQSYREDGLREASALSDPVTPQIRHSPDSE